MQNETEQINRKTPALWGAILLGLVLLAVDFIVKSVAINRLPLNELVPTSVPFFSWRLTYNTGSHYLLGSIGRWIPYRLLMGVAGAAVIGLMINLARQVHQMPTSSVRTLNWLLVVGLIGALGNALEVVTLGRATDFFMIHPFPWPANLADQYVNLTVFVLLPLSIWAGWRETSPPPTD